LGKLSRDSGHMRVPDPPHMITGLILGIHSPGWRVAIAIAGRASSAVSAAPKQCLPDRYLEPDRETGWAYLDPIRRVVVQRMFRPESTAASITQERRDHAKLPRSHHFKDSWREPETLLGTPNSKVRPDWARILNKFLLKSIDSRIYVPLFLDGQTGIGR
jgi:hypothetical protein